MSAEADCRFLEWDSNFFRCRIGRLLANEVSPELLRRALAWAVESEIDCMYCLYDPTDIEGLTTLAQFGFRFVDARVMLDRKCLPDDRQFVAGIRPSRFDDAGPLMDIARGAHMQSRFFADRYFCKEDCERLYATWLEQCLFAPDHSVWVAEQGGRAVGYITGSTSSFGNGEIGLLGVHPDHRGKGIGAALIAAILAWYAEQGCGKAEVVTQGCNVSAQRVYQSSGFKTCRIQFWHHWWARTA